MSRRDLSGLQTTDIPDEIQTPDDQGPLTWPRKSTLGILEAVSGPRWALPLSEELQSHVPHLIHDANRVTSWKPVHAP